MTAVALGSVEFKPWPKIARLNREMVVTEKIDGTNACVIVRAEKTGLEVYAQSRKRIITPEQDNFGFARWVYDNAQRLAEGLGEGYHFGEWYGSGIQRGYGLQKGDKRFMLFNHDRHAEAVAEGRLPENVETSTVLYRGPFDTLVVNTCVEALRNTGSVHVPGFMRPEGVIAYHVPGNLSFKVTVEKDEEPKGKS